MEYIKYEDLIKYNINNNLNTKKVYLNHVSDIKEFNGLKLPINPESIYPQWGGWLYFTSNNIEYKYVSYEELKKYVRENKIKSRRKYSNHIFPKNLTINGLKIPHYPNSFYSKDVWEGWSIFLLDQPNKYNNKNNYITYEELKKYARSKKIKSGKEYDEFIDGKTIIIDGLFVPHQPDRFYSKSVWEGWDVFLLGYHNDKSRYVTYEELQKYVKLKKLKRKDDYTKHVSNKNRTFNGLKIPNSPPFFYSEIWISWPMFLRDEVSDKKRDYYTYEECKESIKKYNIESSTQWYKTIKNLKKGDIRLPGNPDIIYKNKGWEGWGKFLGNNRIACFLREFLSFESAREYSRSLNLKYQKDWLDIDVKDLPPNIPKNPKGVYKDEWIDWFDWLGTDRKKKMSYGERMMNNIYTELNVKFIYDKPFKNCRDISKLRFDFRLPDYDDMCHEFDGMQHFIPRSEFGGIEGLNNTQRKDKIKDEWCKKNGITIIRFNYTQSYEEIRNAIIDILFPDPLSTNFQA